MSRSTAGLFYDSDDSEYKAVASEDSESDESTGKKLQGKGKKPQRKGKAGNKTATIPAKNPPPSKKAKPPTDKVCYSHFIISSLTL
jgi:hypothetical protein